MDNIPIALTSPAARVRRRIAHKSTRNGKIGLTSSREDLPTSMLLAALDDPHTGVLIFDPQLRNVHATSRVAKLLGVTAEAAADCSGVTELLVRSALDAPSAAIARDCMEAFVASERQIDSALLFNPTANEWLRMKLRNLDTGRSPSRFAATFGAVSAPLDSCAAESSNHDSLTGLATRTWFESALQRALNRVREVPVAVLFIDLDRFKYVNDTLGHPVGDSVLRRVADRLRCALHKNDTLARFGGDEFAVLIDPSPGTEGLRQVAERIVELVSRTYLLDGHLVNIGASVGIAESPADGNDSATLLRNADLALYKSKASGKGQFTFFDVSMEQRALARRLHELELRKALALRQLELFYQPQMGMSTGSLVGFEALLRWRHPERGVLAPDLFLALAEEIGLIVPIGEWVLRTACREAVKWPAELTIAVNASPVQFDTGKFAGVVRRALHDSGLPGERLEIEITEGILLRNSDVVQATLEELRSMKVRIAMDDFGTGYSSLSQLAKFPFDKIKIDRSLAGSGGDHIKKRAIVRAITALGQSLCVCTVAEGVEDATQLARLRMDGCSSVQGYFISRPVPANELRQMIARLGSPPADATN